MIDIIASEYGWGIANSIYLDQAFILEPIIRRRKLEYYRLQASIALNPHTKNPRELFDLFDKHIDKDERPKELDVVGLDILKSKMAIGSKIMVK